MAIIFGSQRRGLFGARSVHFHVGTVVASQL
jgi:hypothetical protein